MSMKELFAQDTKLVDLQQRLQEAFQADDKQRASGVFAELFQYYAETTRQEYEELRQEKDVQVLAARGVRQLTTKEREYYQRLGEAMNAPDPRQAINNLDVVMPETVIDDIFSNLSTNHPLLEAVNFSNTRGAIRMMMNTNGYQKAAWGKLCSSVVQELTAGFKEVDASLLKLSAFIPVCKAMLDMGPEWLDRFIRQFMTEALANGLEYGIAVGTGNDEPIGMNRQVGDNVTVTGGVYPEKAAIKVTDFSPATMGNLVSILAADPNGNARVTNGLILLVNPQDYFQKVMPATTIQAPDGTYRNDVFPLPLRVIQSPAKPRGKATLGIGRLYYAFAGMNKNGRIEYSDDYHFLEDERVYLIKTYANGMPADNNAFLELDITGLLPATWKVTMVEEKTPSTDAALSDLKIGSLALSPAFDKDLITYTASTSNATNTVNAVPSDAKAAIEVKVNGKEIDNGSAATWTTGSNTVAIKVTAEDGSTTKTYSVTVTKSAV